MSTFKRPALTLSIIFLMLAACSLPFLNPTPTPEVLPPVATTAMPAVTTAILVTPASSHPLTTPLAGVAQPVTLHSIKMFDALHGWASVTGDTDDHPHLVTTSDGGKTWKEMTPAGMAAESGYDSAIIIFTSLDANTLWATLSSLSPSPDLTSLIIWRTTDGGKTWSSSDPLPVADISVEFIMPDYFGFSDPNNGWLLTHNGAGMNHDYVSIFTTKNGGASWKRVVDPYMDNLKMSFSKTGLVFFDANRGWITLDSHGVQAGLFFYTTTDGGNTWQDVSLPSPGVEPGYFNSMDNVCGLDGIVYAANPLLTVSVTCMHSGISDPNRWLYTTSDAGNTWSWHAVPGGFGNSFFLSATQGWFLGHIKQQDSDAGTLYVTYDSGATWAPIKNVNWSGIPQFIDAQNGWVIARTGTETAFVHTIDGGKTWAEIKAIITP